jgi:hypothetical protein
MTFAATIPDGYLIVFLSLFGTFVLGVGGFIARELYRASELNGRTAERLDEMDRRINALEGLYLPTHERRTS